MTANQRDASQVFADIVAQWRPEPITETDTVSATPALALSALFDVAPAAQQPGDPLPPLWHWLYFPAVYAQAGLGEDGHPQDAAQTPPIPNRRRMFGGGRLTVSEPLRLGETVERRSGVINKRVRDGRSGPLLIVTVRNTFSVNGALRCVEEQDLVYLAAAPARPSSATDTAMAAHTTIDRSDTAPAADGPPPALRMQTSEVLLFRFSALTWNSHRIHYDHNYATQVEGHPALVVHGPLLALLLLEVPRRSHPDRNLATFRFRAIRPLSVGDVIDVHERSLQPEAGSDTGLALSACGRDGAEAMQAQVEWLPPESDDDASARTLSRRP